MSVGFDERISDTRNQFIVSPFDLQGYDKNHKFKKLGVAKEMFVWVTDQNKMFRWREHDGLCKQFPLPDRVEDEKTRQNAGNIPGGSLLGAFSGLVRKVPLGEEKLLNDYPIQRIYIDRKGYHCLMNSDAGDSCYLNVQSDVPKYLLRLKGRAVTSICFDENSTFESTKVEPSTTCLKL